jgi:hypothetical protein
MYRHSIPVGHFPSRLAGQLNHRKIESQRFEELSDCSFAFSLPEKFNREPHLRHYSLIPGNSTICLLICCCAAFKPSNYGDAKAAPGSKLKNIHTFRALMEKARESSACHNFGVRAPNKKRKKCLVGSASVGWAKPRSGVPTSSSIVEPRGLRCAQPTLRTPPKLENIHTLRALAEKSTNQARVTISASGHQTKRKKCLVGSKRWLRPAEFLGFRPRGELKRRPLAHLTGRQPVTPVDGASCGSRGRRLVTAAPGRLRASSGRHYDRPGRCSLDWDRRARVTPAEEREVFRPRLAEPYRTGRPAKSQETWPGADSLGRRKSPWSKPRWNADRRARPDRRVPRASAEVSAQRLSAFRFLFF